MTGRAWPPSPARHRAMSRANWRETCSGLRCCPSMSPNTRASSRASCSAMGAALALARPAARPTVGRVEVDEARLAALGVALDDLGALACDPDHPGRPADPHRGLVEVDVAPAQRQGLAAAHAGVREHVPQREVVGVPAGPAQERGELPGGPRVHLRRLRLPGGGRRGVGGRVAGQAAGLHRGAERGRQDRVDVADGPRRQALALAVVGAAAALELPVQPVDPLGGQRGQRHRAERRGRGAAGCSSGSWRSSTAPGAARRPTPRGTRRAAACSGRPARRARRRSACRGAPAARPASSSPHPLALRRVPNDGCPIAHRSPAFVWYGHTEPSPGLRRLVDFGAMATPRRARGPGARAPARTCRGSSSSASARLTHRTSASSSSSPTKTSVPWVGRRRDVDHPCGPSSGESARR